MRWSARRRCWTRSDGPSRSGRSPSTGPLTEIREIRRRHSEAARELAAVLDDLRRRSVEAESRYEALRLAAARHDVEEAELRTLLQGAVERLRDTYGVSPQQAAEAPLPPLPDGVEPQQRMDQLSSELEIIGPVNPLALAEYDELYERYELLRGQLDDIRAARRDLNRVIRSIDGEIKSVFSSAFVDVGRQLRDTVRGPVPRRRGAPHPSPIPTTCSTPASISRPSRRARTSNGCRCCRAGSGRWPRWPSCFAVFRSRPSPFYVLDEVEAALDDVNLHRFLKLVDEFRADAQMVIVTHQKRTMEAADCLQGVSMKPGGSSMVVSERVSDAA